MYISDVKLNGLRNPMGFFMEDVRVSWKVWGDQGDACNKSTFLFDENTLPVEAYRESLCALSQRLEGTYDRVFISHHDMEMQKDIMKNVIAVCDAILAGKTEDIPFSFMGQQAYIAYAVDGRMNRLDGVDGNIIYNKERIKKTV